MKTKAALEHLTENSRACVKHPLDINVKLGSGEICPRLSQKEGHGNAQKRLVCTIVGIVLLRTE